MVLAGQCKSSYLPVSKGGNKHGRRGGTMEQGSDGTQTLLRII